MFASRLAFDLGPRASFFAPQRPQVRGDAGATGVRLWVVWPSARRGPGWHTWSWARRRLNGRIEAADGGSVLRGRFTFSRLGLLGLAFGLLTLGAAVVDIARPDAIQVWVPELVMIPLELLFGAGLLAVGLWRARNDDAMLRVWVHRAGHGAGHLTTGAGPAYGGLRTRRLTFAREMFPCEHRLFRMRRES